MTGDSEPRFDVLVPDEMTGIEAGRAVLEGEMDATVRTHPWLPDGTCLIIDRAKLGDFLTESVELDL